MFVYIIELNDCKKSTTKEVCCVMHKITILFLGTKMFSNHSNQLHNIKSLNVIIKNLY